MSTKPALLQAPGEQTGPLTVPPNDLDQIATPSSTENEHVAAIRVLLQRLFRLSHPASVANPRRISVTPAASHTFVFDGTGINSDQSAGQATDQAGTNLRGHRDRKSMR